MILFDTSVIIDARDPSSPFHSWSKQQIAQAVGGDGAAVNPVVLAEASVRAVNKDSVPGLLTGFGMTLVDLPVSAAVPAAKAFAVDLDRRKAEGHELQSKMPLPDFLIGEVPASRAVPRSYVCPGSTRSVLFPTGSTRPRAVSSLPRCA